RIKTLDQEIAQYKEHLDRQRLRYQQLKHRSVEYFRNSRDRHWATGLASLVPDDICVKMSAEDVELELLKRKEALGIQQ
ncbi:MAG: hypothetical protein KJP06_05385, partial [Deltaproteobacteria bacterium]|nr:hypothetical protein [Deltaproteobacteria bacterium]